MNKPTLVFLALSMLLPIAGFTAPLTFNADSAFADIEYLSVTIGPRPIGSFNERVALDWTVRQFHRFGADSAYVMPISYAKAMRSMINTRTGVAIGVFRGDTDSTIVLGSHIDSGNRQIPGANDNASGTASIIELARLWSQRQRHYTLVFAAFGGEEVGLVGSKYFVEHYPDSDRVVLMIQLDMTGSNDPLLTLFETRKNQAPAWLVQDALAMDAKLGYHRLRYPTHFSAINNINESAGSDHMPFLDHGIPAICFTNSENNSPIHTPEDRIDFIDRGMLGRSGLFIDSLITKYQLAGIPSVPHRPYILWQFQRHSFFMPHWMAYGIIGLASGLGIWAFFYTRKHRSRLKKALRVRFTGLKLLFFLALIAAFMQVGEALMQLIKGLRYAWMLHVRDYLCFAGLWAAFGAWVALQFTRFWQLSSDTYVYSKRALAILLLFVIAATIGSPHLGIYPALTLICASLAFLIPIPAFKLVLALVAPVPLALLMFNEVTVFIARTMANMGFTVDTFWKAALLSFIYVLIPVIWFLAVYYLYWYLVTKVETIKNLTAWARKPAFGLVLLLPICVYAGYLYASPAYNEMWRPAIHVNANYQMDSKDAKLELTGNEYFRSVQVQSDTLNLAIDGRIHHQEIPVSFTADWLGIKGTTQVDSGARDTLTIDWQLVTQKPWYRVILELKPDTLAIADVVSDLVRDLDEERLQFIWHAEPPQSIPLRARLTVHHGASIIRKVTAIYPDLPIAMHVSSELASVRYQTTVVYQDTVRFEHSEN